VDEVNRLVHEIDLDSYTQYSLGPAVSV
jgi:hypothetical protein